MVIGIVYVIIGHVYAKLPMVMYINFWNLALSCIFMHGCKYIPRTVTCL